MPARPVTVEAPRSKVMRVRTFLPFPNVGQTWMDYCSPAYSMPTSYHPSANVFSDFSCHFLIGTKHESLFHICYGVSWNPGVLTRERCFLVALREKLKEVEHNYCLFGPQYAPKRHFLNLKRTYLDQKLKNNWGPFPSTFHVEWSLREAILYQ